MKTLLTGFLLMIGIAQQNCRNKTDASASTTPTPSTTVESAVGFCVKGRFLYDPCNNKVTLRGVNKMNIWTDRTGSSFPEIAQTGANCVRIVWKALEDNGQPTKAADLDALITACVAQQMIPMVEAHDATGNWSMLGQMVNFWKRADIVTVIKKHQKYLLLNIANECGDDQVTDLQFTDGYSDAVQQLRQAGIHTPLVIDGTDYGKNLEQLVRVGPGLMQADPDKNLLFSVHTYWPIEYGATPEFIKDQFSKAVNTGLPFIIGEFAGYGAYAGGASMCSDQGRVDYQTIVSEAQRLDIGWLAWEWGPGNVGGGDSLCVVMDMTTNSKLNTLKGWGKDVALTNAASIQKTAVRAPFLVNNRVCK
ncbi:glycoside hydrolase family 5 protein [Spirosoma utsteinense]|uniref:Mannan endo-1,4-beta-mannosidase n=1 Tax=Spirosoma utsteinense TaxID=2585773 RepID=A0ABR6WCH5_9BACT|nr:cellulase family glycosylhydrolase [Spirosoma utsteinense]MBC3788320.1 mannan endo-1,4-beta-mannosidase [Spirosoma utsteinense]MBC3794226.1 mannan endo-1,4-beta-mannosidase [Spirosoma utsteinense]